MNDYYCYGVPILAPAAGVIVEVRDDVRDASGVGTGWIDSFTPDFRDNFVVIRRAEGEYNFLAHLVPGNSRVVAGERAARGQQVGRCGYSGHSTEPQPHFRLGNVNYPPRTHASQCSRAFRFDPAHYKGLKILDAPR